jgi:hypothetical protein
MEELPSTAALPCHENGHVPDNCKDIEVAHPDISVSDLTVKWSDLSDQRNTTAEHNIASDTVITTCVYIK